MKDAKKTKSFSSKIKDGKPGSKYPSKPKGREGTVSSIENTPDLKTNHISWYTSANPSALQSANIWFSNRTGTHVPLGVRTVSYLPVTTPGINLPGVAVLNYMPVYGECVDESSVVNIAAQDMYSWIRHFNSGSRNYFAPDLMVYILAIEELYVAISQVARLFGVYNKFSVDNAYYPKAIFYAAGVDYSDFVNKKNNYLSRLNNIIAEMKAFVLPKGLNWLNKHNYLCGSIFKDNATDKGQIYMYQTVAPRKFDATAEGGGSLRVMDEAVWFSTENSTALGDILDTIKEMLDAILANEDIGIISGDVNKAYGDVLTFNFIPESFELDFIEDYTALETIQNTTICGELHLGNDNFSLMQVQGTYLRSRYYCEMPTNEYFPSTSIDTIITTEDVSVTPEKVIENTRNIVYGKPMSQTDHSAKIVSEITSCGDVIVCTVNVVRYLSSGKLYSDTFYSNFLNFRDEANISYDNRLSLTNFNYHPLLRCVEYAPATSSTGNAVMIRANAFVGNVANFSPISESSLRTIHEACILGLFNIGTANKL